MGNIGDHSTLALLLAVVINAGCSRTPVAPEQTESYFVFSFENDFDGWSTKSTDVNIPPAAWSIVRSQVIAWEGRTSVCMSLDNMTDAGKIWIERPFLVKPNGKFRVTVAFAFASKDYGTINLWRIISGAGKDPARQRTDLVYQADTGNGAESDVGFRWMEKSYVFAAESGADGLLYVDVGIWGTWETLRTYHFDSIRITIVEMSEGRAN